MYYDGDGIAALSANECRARMAAHPLHIGRVAFMDDGYPVVLPVNYRLLDGAVVFRTGIGSKLDAALRGAAVSFEVDSIDPAWQEGWSVLVKGRAEELAGDELARAQALSLRPWAQGSRPRYVVIRPEHMTGRRIT